MKILKIMKKIMIKIIIKNNNNDAHDLKILIKML